jgi:hypothetical protein
VRVARIGFNVSALQTQAFVVIVFGNQATTDTNRERARRIRVRRDPDSFRSFSDGRSFCGWLWEESQ